MENYKGLEDHNLVEQEIVRKKRISIKAIILPMLFTIVLSLVFSFCMLNTTMRDLEGVWVRQPDDNPDANGMIIEIKKNGAMYVGEVIDIDDDSTMPIGTFKWNGFQKDALDVFAYYDMLMSTDPTARTYGEAYALISANGKKLTLYAPGASRGRHQVWIKE